jgi:hypothetical protein
MSDSNDLQPTKASAWRKSAQFAPTPLELPTGNVALVRAPGAAAFLTEGLVPNALLPIIQDAMDVASKGKKQEVDEDALLSKLASDPEKIRQVFEMADAVTVYCVVDPPILPAPKEGEERDPEKLYVDQVDNEDKMFIMNVAMGGTANLKQFRSEQGGNLGALRAGQGVEPKTKRTAGSRRG